jgi:thymidylate synthase
MNVFKAESADLAWRMAANKIVHQHGTEVVSSRNGQAIDLLHASVTVTNARARWVASRMPAMNIALVIAEVAQIVAGGDDVHFLEHWFSRYGQFVGSRDKAAGAYGARLRVRWGFDQIARAAESLAAIGESRQIVLSIWDPRTDLPEDNGQPRSCDVPCNVLNCLRLINGRLHWLQTARSNDLFRGLPNNIVQFSCLQEIIAGWIGAEVGQYTHAISSLHAYVKSLSEFRIDPELPAVVESSDIRLPRTDTDRTNHHPLRHRHRQWARQHNWTLGPPRVRAATLGLRSRLHSIHPVTLATRSLMRVTARDRRRSSEV